MNVYDRVAPNNATGTLMMLALGVLIAYVMELVLKTLRTVCIGRACRRFHLFREAQNYPPRLPGKGCSSWRIPETT